jgi:phosphate starvation-inducible protein PhoH and related proteins
MVKKKKHGTWEDQPERGKKSKKDKANYRKGKTDTKIEAEVDRYVPKVAKLVNTPITAKTAAQRYYMGSIERNILTLATGPAGTGKTFVGCAMACDMLRADKIDHIIISRPAVTDEEDWGALPGELDEKYAPFLEPYWESFHKRLGVKLTEYYIKQGRIIAVPLGFMRGRTFENCWVFLDEAQNTTKKQMETFLTRAGENCRMVVSGDLHQIDLPIWKVSGLRDAIKRFRHSKTTGIINFTTEDIVRSGFAREVVEAYAVNIDKEDKQTWTISNCMKTLRNLFGRTFRKSPQRS